MTDFKAGTDFAFADVVRISACFEDTGRVKSRQKQSLISLFGASAKSDCTPFEVDVSAL